jgi:cyclic pyranopterin phosphate synthase
LRLRLLVAIEGLIALGGSFREATAEALVKLPPAAARALKAVGHRTKKGPVFDTAIVAGVMAAKRTHELIPFCHPLALERCKVEIASGAAGKLRIVCSVAVHHKTGVEMEALMGATAAALTIYDMCKALSHDIVIESTRLLSKTGGKRDYSSTRTGRARPRTQPRKPS